MFFAIKCFSPDTIYSNAKVRPPPRFFD